MEKYNEIESTIKNAQQEISKRDLGILYSDFHIPPNSVILVVPSASCPYCLTYATHYFLVNLKKMEEDQAYLLASEQSANKALKSIKSSKVIFDKKGELENLLNQSIDNPALMLWNGKKVTRTMILPPDDVEKISMYLEISQEEFR